MPRKIHCAAAILLLGFSASAADIDEKEIDRFIDLFFIQQDIKAVQALIDPKAQATRGMKAAALAEHWIRELKESRLKFTLKPKRFFDAAEAAAVAKEHNARNAGETAFKDALKDGRGCAVVMSYEHLGRKKERVSLFVFSAGADGKTRLSYLTD